jgi:hypothetical protein
VTPGWRPSILVDTLRRCFKSLEVGTDGDVVRAAVWTTSCLPHESWPAPLLGVLARRGAAHNGLAHFPEALALKVSTAAVDALADAFAMRRGAEDMVVLGELRGRPETA